jgi:hypothetical protein
MSLPQQLPLNTMQTQWAAQLNPLISSPTNSIRVLHNVQLTSGNNVINHLLGQTMQGWFITDIQGVASIYRPSTAPFNALTLTLNSSAAVTVSIGVF